MPEKNSRWRRFQAIKGKRKDFSRRAKRAEGATVRHAHKFLVSRWDNIRSVRRHILTWMIGLATLIVIVGVQMVWFQQGYLKVAPVSGGVYAEAVKGTVSTLNPLYAVTGAEQSAARLIFSSLYTYDTTGHLSGDIARTMQIDPTGKIYTVALRSGVKWQDGRTLGAKDVAFTVELMKNPAVRSTQSASWKDINIEVVDDHTVRFTLPAAYAAFPQALTFPVLPKHVLASVDPHQMRENNFSTNPVGSGPFKLRLLQVVSESEGRKIVHLGANPSYYGGKPRLDRFQLHAYGSMDDIGTALRTGEVTAAADISSDVARSVDTQRYDVLKKPTNSGVYAILNTTGPQLKDVNVRRAIQIATNTDQVRSAIYGNPRALSLPFVDGQVEGGDLPVRPGYDAEHAGRLLDGAGWQMGNGGIRTKDGEQLRLRIVTRKNSDYERALEVLSGQWHRLGIAIDKEVIDSSSADRSFTQTILQPRNYDVLIDELLIGGDPDVFAYWHSRGLLNFANYSNSTSDDALVSGRNRSDVALRAVKYKAFAKQWLDDVPAIGLYQSNMLYVQNKQLQSITDDEVIVTPSDRFANLQYWTAERGEVFKTP